MLSIPNLASKVIISSEDEEDNCRWSYRTYGDKDKKYLRILTAYLLCIHNYYFGVSTVHLQ